MNPAKSEIVYPTPRVGMSRGGKIFGFVLVALCVVLVAQGVFLSRRVHRLSEPDQALFEAVNRDDVAGIEAALAKGANVNARDRETTPLMNACLSGQVKSADALCKHGADVNAHDKGGWTSPFLNATNFGNGQRPQLLRVLLHHGLDVRTKTLAKQTPLTFALDDNDLELANFCLDRGADPNVTDQLGDTALTWALTHGEWKFAKRLLDKDANVQMSALSKGYIALAISQGQYDIAKMLLNKGASLEDRGNDAPPLLWAVAKGRADLVATLLDKGAKTDATDSAGETALIGAAKMGRADLTQLLLAHHADPNKVTPGSPTALQWAKLRHHDDVARLLQQADGE